MTEQKLVVCIMGENAEKFIEMSVESVNEADVVIYCDGGSIDNTLNLVKNKGIFNSNECNCYCHSLDGSGAGSCHENCCENINWCQYINKNALIKNEYNQEDIGMNGKQRNFYLNYLKENYPNDWALCLDADEVVEDLNKIKEFIQTAQPGLYSIKMEHFIGDLGNLDNTVQTHYVLNRLFKISEAQNYQEVEHPILQGNIQGHTDCTTIWHLAYCGFMWDIKKRYENHLKKSNIHTPQFLKEWRDAHYFGNYPKRQVKPEDIPDVILKYFGVEKDEYYFKNRGLEFKHVLQVKQWYDHFKPTGILDIGAGRGPYAFFWKWFVQDVRGIEISQWSVNNAFTSEIHLGDITKDIQYFYVDLITAIDVLEHLDDNQLDKTLKLISKYGNKFIFSIPFIGDPNLLNDKTHKQFHDKQWWIDKISSYGIKTFEAPKEWMFSNQILIGIK